MSNNSSSPQGITKGSFKASKSFEDRVAESRKISTKYPDRIPVLCEKSGKGVPDIDKTKFLVPADLKVAQFLYVIRRRLKVSPNHRLYFLVNHNFAVPTGETLSSVYERHKDDDGFLYMTYAKEPTFGGM